MVKDYYKVLEVSKTDSADTIKKNYKKLAMKFHPDKASNDEQRKEYEEKFKEINEAYTVLSDDSKRKQYDMGGGTGQFRQSQGQGFGGGDFSDIIEELLRGGGFGNHFNRGEEKEDNDLHYSITIDFIEAAFGCEKEITIKRNVKCDSCEGSGSEDGKFDKCSRCSGHGRIEIEQRTPFGMMRRVVGCDDCKGKGKIPRNKCKKCDGEGIINKKENVKIKTPAGIDNEQTIRISNSGSVSKNGRKGDLYITINVKPHKIFKRQRFDVYMDLEITFAQAALGCEIKVPTLKEEIKIKIAKGTESGSILRLRDKGIPYLDDPEYLGDQFVNIIVKTPKKLTRAQTKLYEELAKLDK